jgi:hypothetical protein
MKSLIFLDDERNFEDVSWIDYQKYENIHVVRRMCDFMFVVMNSEDLGNYDFSFDHDIQDFSCGVEQTGYDCVKWLCEYVLDIGRNLSNTMFYYHTQNPIGRKNMESYMTNFIEFTQKNDLLKTEQRNKRRLAKIHKLKRENRVLASRRKAKLDTFNRYHTTTILNVDIRLLHYKTHDSFIKSINKISENIGKNSAKIMRLRTLIKQSKITLK